MQPTPIQQLAIQAKLNFMLGPEIYDKFFLGFVCGRVDDKTAYVFVENEDTAGVIDADYSWHIAVIVESILKTPVRFVSVLPRNFSDRQVR
jgi:hypothetical protein